MDDLRPQLFVKKGLLPENLPPTFSSQQLWAALPDENAGYLVTGATIGQPCPYCASKRGGQRRAFGVPHPLFIREQALFLRERWGHFEGILDKAAGSASRPTFDDQGPRYVRIAACHELPRLQLRRLSRYRHCLVTDVSRFYHSVYTHVVPWASNGRSAKPSRMGGGAAGSDVVSVIGKVIEQAVREGDDGIIKRAIRIVDERKLWDADLNLLEHFLAQCAVQFPHSFD